MDADSEPASDSETAESDANAEDEDSSGVTAATADEQTVPVTVSEEYAILLATNQADSMMGHAGMEAQRRLYAARGILCCWQTTPQRQRMRATVCFGKR